MSKNSKTTRLHNEARQRKGIKGPAKTTPKHGKTKAWWQTHLSYSTWFNGGKHELAQRNTNHNVQQ